MPKQATGGREQMTDIVGHAQDLAERGYEVAKQAVDAGSERIDDLSRFGKQRPLLAMGVSFLVGFFVAKTFF